MSFSEEFPSLTPVNFFQFTIDCHHVAKNPASNFLPDKQLASYLLPDLSPLSAEENFAKVFMGWSVEGIAVEVVVQRAFKKAYFPDVQKGDSVELFFDTRNIKSSGFNTKFCHHFCFLAEALKGQVAAEITKFRTEDAHPLCLADNLIVKSTFSNNSHTLRIFIPTECLHGYDPDQFKRLGFTYRINSYAHDSQHFVAVSSDYPIEQQPSLWASLKLVI